MTLLCDVAGTGEVPTDIQATVKLQLLAFLLFSTLESVHRLAAAFGGGDDEYATDESAQALLPGPHAALRCLIRLDAGICSSQHIQTHRHLSVPPFTPFSISACTK